MAKKKSKRSAADDVPVAVEESSQPRPGKRRKDGVNAVSKAIAGINKQLKSEYAAYSLGGLSRNDDYRLTGWMRTGIYTIDYLLGDMRGVPLGMCGVLCGDEGTGKSALAQRLMLDFQLSDGVNVYFDYDGDLQPKRLRNYGIDIDNVIVPQVTTLEEGFDAMAGAFDNVYGKVEPGRKRKKAIKVAETPMLAVIDSVAAARVRAREDADSAEDRVIGRKAAVLAEQDENLRVYLRDRRAAVVFLNEIREDIGGNPRFGKQLKMPGGRSLRFIASWILRLSKGKTHRDSGNRTVGWEVWANTAKSRYGQPHTSVPFYLSCRKGPEGGPHPAKSNYMFLKHLGLLAAKGAKGDTIRGLKGTVGVFTKQEWRDVMNEHDDAIREHVRAWIAEQDAAENVGDASGDEED